jgi:hypothetical protein
MRDWEANIVWEEKMGQELVANVDDFIFNQATELTTLQKYERENTESFDTGFQAFVKNKKSQLEMLTHAVKRKYRFTITKTAAQKERIARRAAFKSRLGMGIFGALAFLVPMLVMVLHPTLLTTLLTTVVSVLFVAAALTIWMPDSDGKDVLGATAAYTAVLVVFVGTSSTTSGLSHGVVGAITGGVLVSTVVSGFALSYTSIGTLVRNLTDT